MRLLLHAWKEFLARLGRLAAVDSDYGGVQRHGNPGLLPASRRSDPDQHPELRLRNQSLGNASTAADETNSKNPILTQLDIPPVCHNPLSHSPTLRKNPFNPPDDSLNWASE